MSDDAYHRGYVDVPSERVWDLPHIKRAIAWASFERERDEKRPDGSVHLHGRYRRGAYVEPTCRRLEVGKPRSEERRVGKECRSRWSPYH